MADSDLDALVIGAGVSGLTTAVCLAEAGLRVRIWTAEPPEATTSVAAGAMWGPYLVEPAERVRSWSRCTLDEFRRLAERPGETGVRLMSGIEAARTAVSAPDWADQLDGFRMCEPNELPDGFATGWRFTAPIVDMPVYLDYLQRRLAASGGAIETRRLKSLSEATAVAPMVVNCTGMGARTLVPDPELVPIRGQLVVVENPGLTEFFSEDTGPSSPDLLHIYPQGKTAVLGGLAAAGDATAEPDPEVAASILARCCAVEPRLRNARVIGHRAGLRPTRPFVRVEQEQVGSAIVIHNYGHGGAGVTLSWGCATEVVSLAGAR